MWTCNHCGTKFADTFEAGEEHMKTCPNPPADRIFSFSMTEDELPQHIKDALAASRSK